MGRSAIVDPCMIHLHSRKRNPTWGSGRSALARHVIIVIAVFTSLWCNFLALGIDAGESENKSFEITSDGPTADTAGSVIMVSDDEPEKLASATNKAPTVHEEAGTCYSLECNRTASVIMRYMDVNVDPCHDFYKFACGGFINSTVIPIGDSKVESVYTVQMAVLEQLWKIIENDSESNAMESFGPVRESYKSCINGTSKNSTSIKVHRDRLNDQGGWPVIVGEQWTDIGFNRTSQLYNFEIHEPGYFFIPPLRLAQGFDHKKVKDYYNYIVDIAVILGAERNRAERELEKSLLFEIELAKMFIDLGGNKWAAQKFDANYPNDSDVDQLDIVPGLRNLTNVTPKRIQANYLMMKKFHKDLRYLDDKLGERKFAFELGLLGTTKFERRDLCMQIVIEDHSDDLGRIYMTKYFNARGTKNANEMIRNIRKQYEQMLQQAEWMDEVSRSHALEKLKAVSVNVAGDFLHDNEFDVSDNKSDYSFPQFMVGMSYLIDNNTINIAGASLQNPLFVADRPLYMDYGAIGTQIGHEISHAFGLAKLNRDEYSNIENWGMPSTELKFLQWIHCIDDQYTNYHDKQVGLSLDGFSTREENFADHGGLRAAYLAYDNWAKVNKPEPKLPNLEYTPKQMFWISFGSTWCTKYKTEFLDFLISGRNTHSPNEYRVHGSVSNMPEFAEDFNCPVNSPMIPEKRCRVW